MHMLFIGLAVLLASGAGAQDLSSAQADAGKLLAAFKRTPQEPVVLDKPNPGVTVRLPTWELGALVARDAFAGSASRLTDSEKTIARNVYADAIDLDAVRVVYAPSPTGEPMTWGDTIRMPPNHGLSTGTLVHELAHVWQYQTRGASYISNSMLKQSCAVLEGHERDKAYEYKIADSRSLFDYSAEQQAEILEDYAVSKAKQDDPRYQAFVAEARKAKAIRGHADLFLNRDYGLPPRGQALQPPGWEVPFNGEIGRVPQLEVRF